MKKKLLLTLGASLLTIGLVSCGENNSSGSGESSAPIEKEQAVSKAIELLNNSNSLSDDAVTNSSISIRGNEWHDVEESDSTTGTKKVVHKITRYEETKNDVTLYSDAKSKVEVTTTTSNTDGTETIAKTQHLYGQANGLAVDLVSDYRDNAYTVNNLKSTSLAIVSSDPGEGETTQEETNAVLSKGFIGTESFGTTDHLLKQYFSADKFFAASKAKENASLTKDGNKYSLTSTFTSQDDVENQLIEEYAFTFEFDSTGYLTKADGSLATYAATTAGEKGSKSYEWIVTFTQTLGTKTASGVDLDQYFFQSATDFTISFSETYLGSATEISEKGKKYYINVAPKGGAIANIDKIKLSKVTRNGAVASESDYAFEDDNGIQTITLKKGGAYSLTFKTAKGFEATEEATIVVTDLTSLAFYERPNVYSTSKNNEYLPGSILAGETQFALDTAPTNATDDVTIEILNNDIDATISKVDGSAFTYKLVTDKTGTITIKATSEALGADNVITKEVKVYANTDEGIASFLSETTWIRPNPTSGIASLDFEATTSTSGTMTYSTSSSVGGGFTATGTYAVENGSITLETTTWDPNTSNAKKYKLQTIEVEAGRGDITIKIMREELVLN